MRTATCALAIALAAASLTSPAAASPSAANWHEEDLIGEDAESYYQYLTRSLHPANYYAYRQTVNLQRISKTDYSVLEDIPLRDVSYQMDMATNVWNATEVELPAFDLPAYLRERGVHHAFVVPDYTGLSMDRTGASLRKPGVVVHLMTGAEVEQQIPALGSDPRVMTSWSVRSKPLSGPAHRFFSIQSNGPSLDDGWSVDLLMVDEARLREVQIRLGEAPGDSTRGLPLVFPIPLSEAMRDLLAAPDSVEMCLLESRHVRVRPDFWRDPPFVVAGHPARSFWRRLETEDAVRLSKLLLSVDDTGPSGVSGSLPCISDVFRFSRGDQLLILVRDHCNATVGLSLDGVHRSLLVRPVNADLMEIAARVFPGDDGVKQWLTE